MYYKVIKDNKVVDVLDRLTYLRWQPKNKIIVLCGEGEAQAILGSDGNTVWHVEGFYDLPTEAGDYDVVKILEVDKHEYDQLKVLNGRSVQEILDEYTLLLIQEGVI